MRSSAKPPLRVVEQRDGAPVPAQVSPVELVDVVVRLFETQLLARCQQRDQEVDRV